MDRGLVAERAFTFGPSAECEKKIKRISRFESQQVLGSGYRIVGQAKRPSARRQKKPSSIPLLGCFLGKPRGILPTERALDLRCFGQEKGLLSPPKRVSARCAGEWNWKRTTGSLPRGERNGDSTSGPRCPTPSALSSKFSCLSASIRD